MKKTFILSMATALLIAGCSTVPLTGRRQLNIVPDA